MVRIAPSLDTYACKLFHHGTRSERWRMWTPVVLMVSMVASPPVRTSVSAIVVRGGTTVISNSDAGRILDAYIASILKGIMRTGFMPCNVRRAPDEAMHCQAHSLDADQLDKKPRGQSSPTPGAM